MKASSLLQIATTVAILPLASAETNSNNHTPLRHSHNSNNNNNDNKHPSRHSNNRRRATTESGQQQQQRQSQQSQRNLEVSSSTQDEQSHMHSVTNQQWADLSSIFSQADFSLTPPQSPIKKSSLVDDDEEVADEKDATEREATPTWVCNYNEACPELGSQCVRGFETCFGKTYHSFLCDCVEKEDDDSGDLIYSCQVTEACAKLSTTSVASDDTEKSVSAAEASGRDGSRSKSGKSSKSSKSSKSAKSTYYATSSSSSSTSSMFTDASADVGNNGGDPMAASYTKSGKSSKSKSSKSSKYLKSSKSSKAKYQYAEKVIDTPSTTDTTSKSTPSSVTSPDSTSQSTEGGSTTADPTMQPSAITLRVAPTPIVTTAEPCSGQPCPFDSWCRSRHGRCGPGYAYCNSNSIWIESCNADESSSSSSVTTDKPTKKPTRVRDGTSNFIAGVNIRDFPEVSSSQDTAALMENVNYLGRGEETVSVHGAGAGGGTGDGSPSAGMAIGMAVGLTAATLLGMGWALAIKGYYVRNLGRPLVGAREVTDVGGALGAGVATPELL